MDIVCTGLFSWPCWGLTGSTLRQKTTGSCRCINYFLWAHLAWHTHTPTQTDVENLISYNINTLTPSLMLSLFLYGVGPVEWWAAPVPTNRHGTDRERYPAVWISPMEPWSLVHTPAHTPTACHKVRQHVGQTALECRLYLSLSFSLCLFHSAMCWRFVIITYESLNLIKITRGMGKRWADLVWCVPISM